nr:suppressor of disruption of TFIIS [Ipomoea batatas]
MVEKLGIDRSKTIDLGHLLYKNYGTTLAGLRAIGYDFDYDEFHSFVHGRLPYENLRPDPVLRSLLISLPYRKLIFTNADKVHAIKVLRILGIFVPLICTLNSLRFPHLLSARLFFFQGADYALENIHNIKEALPDRRDSIGSPVARGN